jgi:hypothetical protein
MLQNPSLCYFLYSSATLSVSNLNFFMRTFQEEKWEETQTWYDDLKKRLNLKIALSVILNNRRLKC